MHAVQLCMDMYLHWVVEGHELGAVGARAMMGASGEGTVPEMAQFAHWGRAGSLMHGYQLVRQVWVVEKGLFALVQPVRVSSVTATTTLGNGTERQR